MKAIIFLALVFVTVNIYSQQTAVSFAEASDKEVVSVCPTSDGGYILVQYEYSGSIATPILVKTDVNFEIAWSKKIEISYPIYSTYSYAMELTDGGFLLFGKGKTLAKFSVDGNFVWSVDVDFTAGTVGYTESSKVVEKPDGKLILFSTIYEDFKIIQFSADGVLEWAHKFSSTVPEGYGKCPGFDMVVFSDGSIYASGKRGNDNCFVRIDNAGNVVWTKVIEFDDSYSRPWGMTEMQDGSVLVVGLRSAKGFLMKMSPSDGSVIWQKEVNDIYFEDVVRMGSDTYALLAKDFYDGNDLGILLFDGAGDVLKSIQIKDITDWYTFPRFLKANNKFYITSKSDYTMGFLNFLEFDSTFTFTCGAEPISVSKVAFTLPSIDLGSLEVSPSSIVYSYGSVLVSDVETTIPFADFCSVFETSPVGINEYVPSPDLGFGVATSIQDSQSDLLCRIFPNPANQNTSVTISLPANDTYIIKLSDVSGKLISAVNFSGITTTLGTHSILSGLYVLNIVSATSQKQYIHKLVVE